MPADMHFLIFFDHATRSVNYLTFLDATEALREYSLAEAQHMYDDIEVVLVTSDSLETVQQTHGQYFNIPTVGYFPALAC